MVVSTDFSDRIRAHVTFAHRTQLTAGHKLIFKALNLREPLLVVSAAPATP